MRSKFVLLMIISSFQSATWTYDDHRLSPFKILHLILTFEFDSDKLMQQLAQELDANLRSQSTDFFAKSIFMNGFSTSLVDSFKYFLMEKTALRQKIKASIEEAIKADIKNLITQFMTFNDDVADVLEVNPDVYYEKKLEELKWKKQEYIKLFSNIRRLGWILKSRHDAIAPANDESLVDEAIKTYEEIIGKIKARIVAEQLVEVKEDADKCIKLLDEIVEEVKKERSKLAKDQNEDHEDISRVIAFFEDAKKDNLKHYREKFVEIWKLTSLDSNPNNLYQNFTILESLYKLWSLPDIDPDFKKNSKKVQLEIRNEILDTQDFIIQKYKTSFQQKKGKNSKIRFAAIFLFWPIISSETDHVMRNWFLQRFYQKADILRKQMALSDFPKNPGLLKFLIPVREIAKEFFIKLNNDLIFSELPKFSLNLFLLLFSSANLSLEEFSKSFESIEHIDFALNIYERLALIERPIIDLVSELARTLNNGKLIANYEQILQDYLYWGAKFSLAEIPVDHNASTTMHDFDLYLSKPKSKYNKLTPEMKDSRQLLRLLLLIENPKGDYCVNLSNITEPEIKRINEVFAMKEFSRVPECLELEQKQPFSLQTSLGGAAGSDQLAINLKFDDVQITGNKLTLLIEFDNDNNYTVKPSLAAAVTQPRIDIGPILRQKGEICRPKTFAYENCLFSSTQIRII